MRTTCWARLPRICQTLLPMLFLVQSLVGCASVLNRKRLSFFQSNRRVESEKGPGSATVPVTTVQPVGPEEVARHPHLAAHRGMVLLSRDDFQFVVTGEQNDWTRVGTSGAVPLLAAVFERGTTGNASRRSFVRNPALTGVALRVDCAVRCPAGLAVRFEGVQESAPEAGMSGVSLQLVSQISNAGIQTESRLATRVRVLAGGEGPGLTLESVPVDGTILRFSFEPLTAPGIVLPVTEAQLVEGGDPRRVSYAQVDAAGGQFLVIPAPATPVSISPANLIRIGAAPNAQARERQDSGPVRAAFFAGDRAVQLGFHVALDQEFGVHFNSQTLGLDGTVPPSGAIPSANSWLANDSGDPLLLLNLARWPELRIPLETYSDRETPIPFVLRVAGIQSGESIQRVAGPLVKVQTEPVDQVSLYGQAPGAGDRASTAGIVLPDMVAVVPLGSAGDIRATLMRFDPAPGVQPMGPGIVSVRSWPVRLQLPQGVYEAFFFARSRGLMCRVPFDVSRVRESGSVPPVACGAAQRPQASSRLRLVDSATVSDFDERKWHVVRNKALGVDFKVSPQPDQATVEILRELGRPGLEDAEDGRTGTLPAGHTVLLPCPLDSGLMENLRLTPVASAGTTFAIPAYRCDVVAGRDSWTLIEKYRALGLDARAVPPPPAELPDFQKTRALDTVFPVEAIVNAKTADPRPADGPVALAQALGRAGTFLDLSGTRRIDAARIELVVRPGRARTGNRYLDPPWTLRRLRVLSWGDVLAESTFDPKRGEYKFVIPANARSGVADRALRVELAGRTQGILGTILGVPEDFVVAETQLVDLK